MTACAVLSSMTARKETSPRYSEFYEWTNHRGQVFVQVPNHPRARRDGFYARARLVVEEREGRFLDPAERVYHIDEKPGNDDPDNLMLFPDQKALAQHRSKLYHKRKAELGGGWAALTEKQRQWMETRRDERLLDAEMKAAAEREALRLERLRAAAAARKAKREAERGK